MRTISADDFNKTEILNKRIFVPALHRGNNIFVDIIYVQISNIFIEALLVRKRILGPTVG
jgi:hypothetical protein